MGYDNSNLGLPCILVSLWVVALVWPGPLSLPVSGAQARLGPGPWHVSRCTTDYARDRDLLTAWHNVKQDTRTNSKTHNTQAAVNAQDKTHYYPNKGLISTLIWKRDHRLVTFTSCKKKKEATRWTVMWCFIDACSENLSPGMKQGATKHCTSLATRKAPLELERVYFLLYILLKWTSIL